MVSYFLFSSQRIEDTNQSRSSGDSSDSSSNLVSTCNPQAGPSSQSFYEPNEPVAPLEDVTYSPSTINDQHQQNANNNSTPAPTAAAAAAAAAAEYRAAELGKDQLIDALDVADGASFTTDDSYSENSEEEEEEEEEEDDDLSSDDDTNANDTDQVAMMQLTNEQSTHPSQSNFNPLANNHSTASPLVSQSCISDYGTMYPGVSQNTPSHQMIINSCPVSQYSTDMSSSTLASSAYASAPMASHATTVHRDHGYSGFNGASSASFNQMHSDPPQVLTSPSQVNLIDGNLNNNCNSDGQPGHGQHSQQPVISYNDSECNFLSPSSMTGNYSMSR